MSVDLLANPRVKTERGSSLENRVSALENYVTLLLGTAEIADGAVVNSKLGDGSVTTLKVVNDAITNAKIAINAVQGDVIAAGAITENKLYTGAVTADKVAANAVTAVKIAANAITASKVGANEIIANTANIKNGIILSAKIASLDANKINVGTLTGFTIKTASSGARVQLDSSNYLQCYDASYLRAKLTTDTLFFYDQSGMQSGYLKALSGALVFNCNEASFGSANITTTGSLGAGSISGSTLSLTGNFDFATTQYIKWGVSSQYTFRHDGADFVFNDNIKVSGSIDQNHTGGRMRQYLCGIRSQAAPGNPASGEVYIYYNSSNNNLEVKFSDGNIFILANN